MGRRVGYEFVIKPAITHKEMGTIAGDDAASDTASFYRNGEFTDLCRGPHVATTSKVGAFKLMRVAGAYWRGDEKRAQMQRLYGVAFATREELDEYLAKIEEAKKRDHRKLGVQLDLFTFSEKSTRPLKFKRKFLSLVTKFPSKILFLTLPATLIPV